MGFERLAGIGFRGLFAGAMAGVAAMGGASCEPPGRFAEVEASVAAFEVEDVTVLVGDENGELYRFERGDVDADTQLRIASASKMAFGLVLWDLVQDGVLSLEDRPQDFLEFWVTDEPGGRSDVTLEHLLSFTSGFNNGAGQPGCVGQTLVPLVDCVKEIHDGGLDTAPGVSFNYGPEHMQIAALMAVEATGQSVNDLFRERIAGPNGLSFFSGYGAGDNVRYSGAMRSTAADYGLLLQATLAGDVVADLAAYSTDRTDGVLFGNRPNALEDNLLDWHYGFGFWKECDDNPYSNSCDASPTLSSPGAFGFTPWIDLENGYWAVIAVEQTGLEALGAAERSVLLEQELQPLIVDALQSAGADN